MTSRPTGMGLLTHVKHPLEQLGDLVEAERKRQRALLIAERWRLFRACLAGASVGASLFGTAVVAYAMLSGDPQVPVETMGGVASAVPIPDPAPLEAAAPAAGEKPVLWPGDEPATAPPVVPPLASITDELRPAAAVSLNAQAFASFGERLPRDALAQATLEADETLVPADAMPRDEVRTLVASLDDVRPVSTLVLSGLPKGSLVQDGVDVGDGTIVIPGDKGQDIDVKLPDRVREPVRAEVEMIGPDGARGSSFALTIRPTPGAQGRVPRALRTDDDDDTRKPRRKKRARAADEDAKAGDQTGARASRERYAEQPSYLGRGSGGERRSRRERNAEPPRADRPADEQSKGWSLFGGN